MSDTKVYITETVAVNKLKIPIFRTENIDKHYLREAKKNFEILDIVRKGGGESAPQPNFLSK